MNSMYVFQKALKVEEEGAQTTLTNNESSDSEGSDFDDEDQFDKNSSGKKVSFWNLFWQQFWSVFILFTVNKVVQLHPSPYFGLCIAVFNNIHWKEHSQSVCLDDLYIL